MKLQSINCNHCGAPLQVASNAKYVTCLHCNAQLSINRTGSAAFTEVIERLTDTTERLSDQMAHLSYENALERLDREWENEKRQYMSRRKDGSEYLPSVGGSIGIAVVGCIFGVVMLSMMAGFGGRIAPIGLLVIIGAIVMAGLSYRKAKLYEEAERRYARRRASLSPEQFRHPDDD